jgi:hypothetical protein
MIFKSLIIKNMFSFLLLYFLLIMSSPLIVLVDIDRFTLHGWLAIGSYNFVLSEGFLRSFSFFISTLPAIIFLVLSAPKKPNVNINLKLKTLKKDSLLYHFFFYFLCFIYILFFSLNFGINGVETDSEYRLSGLAYYFRSYIGLLLISLYIYKVQNPSFLMIFIYSLVSGFTSASRFVVVIPLIIYWIKFYYLEGKAIFSKFSFLFLILIFILYTFITNIRVLFYLDDFLNNNLFSLFVNNDQNNWSEILNQGFSQLFLRIGIGRDVILSYEIAQDELCQNYLGLFFKSGSCYDPPFDFYGLSLDNHRFYIAPPQLSSLYIISDNIFIRIAFSFLYGIMLFVVSKIIWSMLRGPYTSFLRSLFYIFIIIFSTVGPILYYWYLLLFSFALFLFEIFILNIFTRKSS